MIQRDRKKNHHYTTFPNPPIAGKKKRAKGGEADKGSAIPFIFFPPHFPKLCVRRLYVAKKKGRGEEKKEEKGTFCTFVTLSDNLSVAPKISMSEKEQIAKKKDLLRKGGLLT